MRQTAASDAASIKDARSVIALRDRINASINPNPYRRVLKPVSVESCRVLSSLAWRSEPRMANLEIYSSRRVPRDVLPRAVCLETYAFTRAARPTGKRRKRGYAACVPIAEENANNGKSKQRGVEHRPRSHHSGARRVCGARIVTGRTRSASDEPWRDLPEDRTAGGLLPEKQTE